MDGLGHWAEGSLPTVALIRLFSYFASFGFALLPLSRSPMSTTVGRPSLALAQPWTILFCFSLVR